MANLTKRAPATPPRDAVAQIMFQALEGLEFGVVIFGAEGLDRPVFYVNSAYQRITGFKPEDGMGRNCSLLARSGTAESALDTLNRAMVARQPCRVDLAREQSWLRFSLSPIQNDRGEVSHMLGLVEDITPARQTLLQLEQSESRLQTIMESVEEGVQLWDVRGSLIYSNPASARQFGEWAGGPDVGRQLFKPDGTPFMDDEFPARQVLKTRRAERDVLMRVVRSDGSENWIRMNAHPILDQEAGTLLGAVTSTSDVTRTVKQEQRLERLAHYDALTQLPNRVLLADRMQQTLARHHRTKEPFAVGLMDLDGFKPVNDTYGHRAGDQVLREVADRLTTTVREGDTVARLGGDEFALLLSGLTSATDCESILRRILNAVAAPYLVAGEVVRISTSVGVTIYPDDHSDPDKLLRHADQAMYQAKQDGKNRFRFFDSALEKRIQANQVTLNKIHRALDQGQFELHFQPVVDCGQGRVVGAEALIRWRHPVLGLLSPAEFLPLIEQDDLIIAMGEWTVAKALDQLMGWREEGVELALSVNIAARQLHERQFMDRFRSLLRRVDKTVARHLAIEIVETAALEDISTVSDLTARLAKLGVPIALDDFGTGHSSLIHLRRLAVDTLKIDQSFVQGMLDDPLDLAIVESVIGLAAAFQHRVVAEGVESLEHILMLRELGCDLMQGYGIAQPMTAGAFVDWFKSFKPDPLWRTAGPVRKERSDIQLLLAEANHRHWVDRVMACVDTPGAGRIPPLEFRQCRFGRWYYGDGMKRFGRHKGYVELGRLHREVHDLANRMLALAGSDRTQELAAIRAEMLQARQRLLDQLGHLQVTLADRSGRQKDSRLE